MDPDTSLTNMLFLARRIIRQAEEDTHPDAAADGLELAQRLVELDNWLTSGGYLPKRWTEDR